MADDILVPLGRRVRFARTQRGWTIKEAAEQSGVSARFLVHLESGRGNISVRRLADLARALQTTPAALLTPGRAERPGVVALLGLRGAGKTTIGKRLARRLKVPFVELDRRIEQAARLSLEELFSLHGEEYYRRLEREVLDEELRTGGAMVLATGGGLVTSRDTFARLRDAAVTIWLRARPEVLWDRVVAQGDRRPMADHPQAMHELRTLLAGREPLYGLADHTIDTSGLSVERVLDAAYARLDGSRRTSTGAA
jgi:XRE family transcriptional regulator, aerobic/anaerobic benzoate catabolism transcriptional regulator